MVDARPLFPILLVVGLVSICLGYFRAYAGPFFIPSLLDAGYKYTEITAIMQVLSDFWAISSLVILVLISLVSYRYGSRYKLTLVSGFVMVVLVYLTEVVGSFVGVILYQIQAPRYPIIQAMLLEVIASYSYVYFTLIGVLAANYVRERRQQETSPKQPNLAS